MFGAILGDIIGQPYEFDRSPKTKQFPLFCKNPRFTDDTVMTIAICDGIMKAGLDADENTMKTAMITSMQLWGHKYPHAGYGGKFYFWLAREDTRPYNSWGNGSAMRVSSVGWLFDTLVILYGSLSVPEPLRLYLKSYSCHDVTISSRIVTDNVTPSGVPSGSDAAIT